MDTHVKVVGWLWILNGLLSVFLAIVAVVVIGLTVADSGTARLAGSGAVCFFLPGVIAYILAGIGLLKYKEWARILTIIVAILNLILFPIGIILGIYSLWVMFNDETKSLFETAS